MADYNINAVTRRAVFTGSAGLGPYAFTFEILDENDLAVYFNATKLTLTTDYTVSINANGTGSVTIVTGSNVPSTPTASDTITILGARDIERTTDFVTAGDLLASSLNEQLDALTIFDQQLAEEGQRSMRAPVFDPAFVADGGTLDMTLPPKADRVDSVMAFDTDGNPVKGPTVTGITTITALAADIGTLADIEDGTVATDAISDTAAIASDVSTVAGIAANVTTTAGIAADVTTVANDAADIGAVAAVSTEVARLGTADAVSDMNTLGSAAIVADMDTLADISTDITAVAAKAPLITADFVSDLNQVAVADVISDINTLATSDIVTDLNLLATSDFVADLNTMATAATVSDLDTLADISTDITTAANASANISTVAGQISPTNNISTVAGISSDITAVATNIADVNNFATTYRIAASAPTTSLDDGDLYFDTTQNQMFVYDGSAWVAVSPDLVGDTTPQLGGDLDTNGNDVNFGDNDKAQFGAGSDLQIYHDGSNSIIRDGGTGTLRFQANGPYAEIMNGGATETMARFNNNGSVDLYYDNSKKLATTATGVDVTGTVTADDVTVTDTSPLLDVKGDGDGFPTLKIQRVNGVTKDNRSYYYRVTSSGELVLVDETDSDKNRMRLDDNGDISFYADNGTTQGLFWDASTQRLGLGTTGPTGVFHAKEGSSAIAFKELNNEAVLLLDGQNGDFTGGDYFTLISDDSTKFHITQAGTKRLSIDADGKVGIGTDSPAQLLHVNSSGNVAAAQIQGASHTAKISTDGAGTIFGTTTNGYMLLTTNSAERMRIDSSGNLLVGRTNVFASSATSGGGSVLNADGLIEATKDGTIAMLNRNTTDGDIVDLRKDGSTVGLIGAVGGSLYVASPQGTDAGLQFGNSIVGPATTTGANRDNAIDLGWASNRFDDIYATNGTIQTSDANEKQQIASLTSAEITAATAISKLFKTFKWNDSVADKGANARTHTGVIAQQVETAMTDAGLDASDYAFFVSTDWYVDANNDEVEADAVGAIAKNRKGIRYPELLAFVGAATEQRLTDIEARLTTLENN